MVPRPKDSGVTPPPVYQRMGNGYGLVNPPNRDQSVEPHGLNYADQYGYGGSVGQTAADSTIGPNVPDPFGGAPIDQVAAMVASLTNGTYGNGSNGSGGGGRSGGAAAAAAAQAKAEAIQRYLGELDAQQPGLHNAVAQKYAGIIHGIDAAHANLTGLDHVASARQTDILAGLNRGATDARTASQGSFAAGDARLAALQSQYARSAQSQDAGAHSLTNAFGAQDAARTGSGVNDLLTAQRAQNTQFGNGVDAQWAARPQMYNALGADTATNQSNAFNSLMSKLSASRLAADQQNAQDNANLAMDYSKQRLAAF